MSKVPAQAERAVAQVDRGEVMIDYDKLENVARRLLAELNEDALRIAINVEFWLQREDGVEARISYRVDLRGEGFPNDVPAACVEKAAAILREFGLEPFVGGGGVYCREKMLIPVQPRADV